MRLIVTRPEPDDDRTARVLIRLGHEAILCPMLDIVSDPDAPIPGGPFQAVVVTSSSAVRALAARADDAVPRSLPLFAVGDRTALEAKRAGFSRARSAVGDLEDLVALLAAELHADAGPLLYAAGEVRAGDLAKRMQEQSFTVETSIVYRAVSRTRLSGVASDAIKSESVDGVLFYSQRSAQAFAAALQAAGLAPLSEKVTLYCLSGDIAAALGEIASSKVLVAEAPNQISLFALIEKEAGPP